MNEWLIDNKKNKFKNSLSQDIYLKLLNKLYTSELVPGDILNRRDVANMFGVSVAPVLEALLQLELEGFMDSFPRKGTVVKPIRREDVYGQLIVREAIECQAARLYCGKPVKENQERLLTEASKLENTDNDVPDRWKMELDFHRTLVGLSECDALIREFSRSIRLGVFYRLNRVIPESDKLEHLSHSELVKKLAVSDADTAEQIIRRHLRSGKKHAFIF